MTEYDYHEKKRKQEVKSLIAYLKYQCLKGYVTLDEALRNLGYKKEIMNEYCIYCQ